MMSFLWRRETVFLNLMHHARKQLIDQLKKAFKIKVSNGWRMMAEGGREWEGQKGRFRITPFMNDP